MAYTFPKLELLVVEAKDCYQAYIKTTQPVGASQTFKGGEPLVASSGLLVLATSVFNPGNQQCVAFSTETANATTGADIPVIMATPWLQFEVNFLGSSAADNVLAAADLFASAGLARSTTLAGASRPGWYAVDGGTAAIVVDDFQTTNVPAGQSVSKAASFLVSRPSTATTRSPRRSSRSTVRSS